MRALTFEETSIVAGGTDVLDDVVVTGRRRMTDDQIRGILDRYYQNQGAVGGGTAGGGGGGGGGSGTAPAPGPVTVWEEDTDGDGKVDTLWIDNNGDGEIGVGDGAAFIDGPWANANAQQMNDMRVGLQNYLGQLGWDTAVTTTGQAGVAVGASQAFNISITSSGMAAFLPGLVHQFLINTFGNIDHGGAVQTATSLYTQNGLYNPYTNGDGVQYQQP